MEPSKVLLQMACCAVFFSTVSQAMAQAAAQPTAVIADSTPPGADVKEQSARSGAELPDSPGTTLSKAQPAIAQPAGSGQPLSAPASTRFLAQAIEPEVEEQHSPQSPPQPSIAAQARSQKPVGTAAAGVIPASGIAASQPAGVAIAPAKQHRVRTLVLKVGALLGAGVAVGSVVALTEATPSKPPGAH